MTEQTEAEIQALLMGESVKGPREFKGKPLAPFTQGIESLLYKVLGLERCDEMARIFMLQKEFGADGATDAMLREYDSVFITLLADAYFSKEEDKLQKRARLLLDTDNSLIYRARVSEWTDSLSKQDIADMRKLVAEILAPVEAAQVELAAAKKKEEEATEPSPIPNPSSSISSPPLPATA